MSFRYIYSTNNWLQTYYKDSTKNINDNNIFFEKAIYFLGPFKLLNVALQYKIYYTDNRTVQN